MSRTTDYGYLSYERHVVLGLDEVDRLVRIVTDELGTRGLTTPFLFSSLASTLTPPASVVSSKLSFKHVYASLP